MMPSKKRIQLPSQQELATLLDYNKETGELFWKKRRPEQFQLTERSREHACSQWNARWEGTPALAKECRGYKIGRINYLYVAAHRVIWKLMTNEDPDIIDHINGDGLDNRFCNLRNVDEAGNKRNVKLGSRNKTGAFGVRFDTKMKKWVAAIQIGTFDALDDAVAARKNAEALLGFHANHGRKA